MKRIFLALLFFAGTTLATATIEKTNGYPKAIPGNVQLPPKPLPPPAPGSLQHRRAQIDAKRNADVRSAKRGIHRAAQKTKQALRSIPPPPRPPRP